MTTKQSLQHQFAPRSICYGCGPANPQGLHIESYADGDEVIATWQPQSYHHAFPNVLNGGIIGTLLDCHCNWASAWYFMQAHHLADIPSTVTASYQIKLLRPTPMDKPLKLTARLQKIEGNKIYVTGELIADDKVCDICEAIFVAVKEGHPAFHRWEQ